MSLARICAALAPLVAGGGDQCSVQERKEYTNCWGDDLRQYDRPAKSFEDCCQGCLDIPDGRCKVFTFDKWNASGEAEHYCFFKSECSAPQHSDSAISGLAPQGRTTTSATTTTTTTTTATTTATTTQPAPTTTSLATTTAAPNLPKCLTPEPTPGVGLAEAVPINVSSHEDCCHRCTLDDDDNGPKCTYVTFGNYKNSSGVACFLHRDKNETDTSQVATALLNLVPRVVRRLAFTQSRGAESCEHFGLTHCQGAVVVIETPGVPAWWFVVSGVGSFGFATVLGFGLSRRLKLATTVFKGRDVALSCNPAAGSRNGVAAACS